MDSAGFQKMISRVLTQFAAAIQNAGIYPDDHPQVLSYVQESYRLLEELLKMKREISILLIGDSLMVDKRPLTITSTGETAFVRILESHSIERMTFINGLSLAQLEEFIRNLSSETVLAVRSTQHIKIGKLEVKDKDELDSESDDDSHHEISTIHDMLADASEEKINNIYRNLIAGEKINVEDTDEVVRNFMNNIQKESNPLRLLAETKSDDEYTFTHTANVGILTLFFAEHLGFKGSYLNNIGVAALLHDVGKVKTPDEILSKKGPLTPDERTKMEMHALDGALNLMEQTNITNLAVLVAMEHHMKYDGTGYPKIKGKKVPHIVSQIVSVADVYDAMRTIRPYRPEPIPLDRIINILMSGSGTAFNPYLVERFLNLVSESDS
ncbi:MAG: HD domain-containing protein [Proteobacteria bacterium]|nr:HD domain-containing protein [Pseudomonadota bacterium]